MAGPMVNSAKPITYSHRPMVGFALLNPPYVKREIPMPRLDGKVAVVTGAAAGPKAALGAIFARALAAEGAKVVLADTKDCAPVAAEIAEKGGTGRRDGGNWHFLYAACSLRTLARTRR